MKLTGEARTCIKQALQVSCLEQHLESLAILDVAVLCGYEFDLIIDHRSGIWIFLAAPSRIAFYLSEDRLTLVPAGVEITSKNIIKELNRAEKRKKT